MAEGAQAMIKAHVIGTPRIGKQREMKRAVEAYWAKKTDQKTLLEDAKKIRKENWQLQKDAGLDFVTVGDFSFYDHVLDMAVTLGVVPERFGKVDGKVELDTLFRMARGRAPTGKDTTACEMTKWFDTNYHYIVPELAENQKFALSFDKIFDEIKEAQSHGFNVKPTILGPVSFLYMSKMKGDQDKFSLLDDILVPYGQILSKIQKLGVEWVQIEEPILVLDLPQEVKDLFESAYTRLKTPNLKVLLATYFEGLGDNLSFVSQLPVDGLHVDLVRDSEQLQRVLDKLPSYKVLSAGLIDGRNIWRANLRDKLSVVDKILQYRKENVWLSTSCSLLHCPVDLSYEERLDPEIKNWLAFSVQKIKEVAVLVKSANGGNVDSDLNESDAAARSRETSSKIHNPEVKKRVTSIEPNHLHRLSEYPTRQKAQDSSLHLPLFPTTTIGSFPQTQDIRLNRRDFKAGKISESEYNNRTKAEIQRVVKAQEEIGLDVLVHGEPERNDMVEYFGELLDGFAFTQNGWVQSYGSRCVKPPVIYGDVSRNKAMTVEWSSYAQSLTKKPMKGMLTGPVTILCWSFVRDDQPREVTTNQIALALRDEVVDLESNNIKVIQIDEPAFREGLPLRKSNWNYYLQWAVDAFKLSTSGVKDSTQIHTHMCYCEFNDVIEWIAALDADVITIETSRSQMELLEAFQTFKYPNEIGPGVYDIHSPRVPDSKEMERLLNKAQEVIPFERLWVNPDCGLKTRGWEETVDALKHMVNAAKRVRELVKEKEYAVHT
jgi:5-methyltetrahydropteroyltriglutamate--homocysteine methyltransferase